MESAVETGKAENIHDLRIELKKTNASMALISNDSSKSKIKRIVRPIRKIFKIAGQWWSCQIEEEKLKKYRKHTIVADYLIALNQKKDQSISALRSCLDHKPIKDLKRSISKINLRTSSYSKNKLNKFFNRLQDDIHSFLLTEEWTDQKLHQIRRYIKQIRYLKKQFHFRSGGGKGWKSLENCIGDWHDLVTLVHHLKKFYRSGGYSKDQILSLKKIKVPIQKSISEYRHKILTAIENQKKLIEF